MSVLPSAPEKTQGMDMGLELQERSAPLCWPHLNGTARHNLQPPHHGLPPIGTAHHNLPPIAAITSYRHSSSPILKAPKDGPNNAPPVPSPLASSPKLDQNTPCEQGSYPTASSPRERKEDHVFTQPNPPRPPIQPLTRPPTPFPDNSHSTTQVFQNAGLPPARLEPQISPPLKPNNIPGSPVNEPSSPGAAANHQQASENTLDTANDSSAKSDNAASPSDNLPGSAKPMPANDHPQLTVLLPSPQNSNSELSGNHQEKLSNLSISSVNHQVNSPGQVQAEAHLVSYQQAPSLKLDLAPAISEEQRPAPIVENFSHTTTAYQSTSVTVTTSAASEMVTCAATSNYSNPPQMQQPEMRNYSNQSHRYFATSPAETARPYSSPSPRNPLYINPSSSISQSENSISSVSPSINPIRSGPHQSVVHRGGDYLPKMPSPSERKVAQVPQNENNYRRFMNPTGTAQLNPPAGEVAPPMPVHGERFSPQAPLYNQYRGSLQHIHNPERSSNHQDIGDGRNYSPANVRIPLRQDTNHPIQSERGAPYYPSGNRTESGNVPTQNDRRPAYASGTNSNNEAIHSFPPQSSRVGYPPPSGARNYAPQPDRAVMYSAPLPAQSLETLRSYHDKNGAVNLNARPPQPQNYNVNIGPEQARLSDRPTHIGSLNPYPPQGSAPSGSRPFGPHERASFPSHGLQEKPYHHSERNLPNYQLSGPNNMPQSQRPAQYPPTASHNLHVPADKNGAALNYPPPNSINQQHTVKKSEPTSLPNQQQSRYGFQAYPSRSQPPPTVSSSQTHTTYSSSPRPPQDPQYYRSDSSRQPWTASAGSSRGHEAMHTFMQRPAAHRVEPEKQVYHPQMPHGATPIPRNDNSYQHSGHSPMIPTSSSSRDRGQDNPNANALPRINPPSVVNVSSSRSPRFSSHPSLRPNPYPHSSPSSNSTHTGATYSYGTPGQNSTSVSSSFSSTLPRVNFPSPAVSSFNSAPSSSTPSGYSRSSSSTMSLTRAPSPHIDSRHMQSREPPKSQVPGRPAFSYSPQLGSRPMPPSYNSAPRQPPIDATLYRQNASQYTPTRGHGMETDTCRNPFELPTPTSQSRTPNTGGVIKAHFSVPPAGFAQKPAETKSPAVGGFPPRSPYDNYPANNYQSRSDSAMKQCDNSQAIRYPAPPVRTEQRPPSGNDDRQKPQQLSARFPPVPQSNYDLQRQIFDRMTGVQQAPPKLIEKARVEERPTANRAEPPRHKRESPLDLSVKTVRQSADSTRDDVDLYAIRQSIMEARLPVAPKIDFNPNFAGPLVQPESRAPLPPVQSIRKFAQPPADNQSALHRKRPIEESQSAPAAKLSKVDAWELVINEQIEEKLKAARQSRLPTPTAALTPLHPPAQSVTPTNPEILQPSARPPYDSQLVGADRYRIPQGMESSRTGHRGWNPGTYPSQSPGGPDHEILVQQISQGMMPDSRLLQDHSVIDMLRTSLEKKEARLNALQAATRRQPSGQPFDQYSAERMFAPPSYQHGHHRGAEPVPIDIEPTKNYMRGPNNEGDLDGLAAFLAARIRTKAEMKQMGPSSAPFRPPDIHSGRSMMVPGVSPPKLNRENRAPHGQLQRRVIMSPGSEESRLMGRDPAGLRSSSETSVFDFRESDSESEMPMLERQTLEHMRRPRKTLPHMGAELEPQPGPAPKQPEPDLAWDNACDMFVEQLQKRPIKRSVRKKRPNPRFYANEMEAPPFLKVKPEDGLIKEEPAVPEEKQIEAKPNIAEDDTIKTEEPDDSDIDIPPLPVVLKEESSSGDEGLIGVTVVKEGRVKLVTKKQRVVASDSEWGSSDVESSSLDSEVSSEDFDSDDDSEDSTARKLQRRDLGDSSSSEEVRRTRKGRRTRNRAVSASDDDSDSNIVHPKTRRSRNVLKSDSDESEPSDSKSKVRRTRARAITDSDESDTTKKKGPRTRRRAESQTDDNSEEDRKKKKGVKTRQNSKKSRSPARMRLRSKKRGAAKNAAFRPGWEEDLIKFKQQLRMPDRLINVSKPKKRQGTAAPLPDADEAQVGAKDEPKKDAKKPKKEGSEKSDESVQASPKTKKSKKKDKDEKENDGISTGVVSKRRLGIVTRGKDGLMQKRSLRGSVGVRRSNKAVQNSMRHLNKGKKRLKLRRKFRSGFDYMRRKKKQSQRKEGEPTPSPVDSKEPKRKERTEALDVSAEIKSWVVNKSAGETVLHRAARLGYADAALYCLETLHLAPSPRDHAGYTPLHEACSRGHVAVANYLLQFGANVSESARGGVRPLHQAAENNHMELVRLLLAYGADPLLATYTGQTALSLAANDDVRELIQQHLADVQGEDAPKWPFDGPASVFDPAWAVNPLADPPSPDSIPLEIEMEVSKAMLPPLYRLLPIDGERCDPSERWLLLDDLADFAGAKTADDLVASLPNVTKCEINDTDFQTRAFCCNILSAPSPRGSKVHLIRYDETVQHLLDVEVVSVSLTDQ